MFTPTRSISFAAVIALLAACCTALLDPTPALACSGGSCFVGWFLPADGRTVPANATALVWMPARDYTTDFAPAPERHLWRIDGAEPEAIDFTLEAQDSGPAWVRLSSPLVPGARYRFEVAGDCATPAVEFMAVEEAPLPDTLGTVTATSPRDGEIQVATDTGSCDTPLPAVISDVDLELADESSPWSALFLYTTKVDGETWNPSWSLAPEPVADVADPRTKVFAECADRPLTSGEPIDEGAYHNGLREGGHVIVIEARLPGVDRVLQAKAKKVVLACEDAVEKDAGSAPVEQDAGTAAVEKDAGTTSVEQDASAAPLEKDAGAATRDEDSGAASDGKNTSTTSSGDCAVVHPLGATSHGAPASLSCLLALLAASSRRLRRPKALNRP